MLTSYGDTWCTRFRAARAVSSCVDLGRGARHRRGRKARGGNAHRGHVGRVVPLSVAAHPYGAVWARSRVDAVTAVGVRSAPSVPASRLTSLPSASRCQHGSANGACVFFWRLCSGAWRGDLSATGVKCNAPAVEFVQRDAEQLGHAPSAESFPAAMSARTACLLEPLQRSPVQVYLVGKVIRRPTA